MGARTVTVTKNEILTGLNKPGGYILPIVRIDAEKTPSHDIRQTFEKEPDLKATGVIDDLEKGLTIAKESA